MSQEEWIKLRESVPYVKLYQYNPKHLYPKLNGYGDNGQRKVWSSCVFHVLYLFGLAAFPPLRNRAVPAGRLLSMRRGLCCAVVTSVTTEVRVAKMPFVFSHVEYCDMHFVYGFCNGNALAAVEE